MTEDDATTTGPTDTPADTGGGHRADTVADTVAAELAFEIKRRRLAAGLTQRALGQASGYTREYVSTAERPDSNIPSHGLVRALDTALNADGALVQLRARAKAAQLNRRSILHYGIATAATAALSPHDAHHAIQSPATPPALGITPAALWATPIHDAVLNPAEAARHAAAETDGQPDTAVRRMVDRAIRHSLASDFDTLARSLPTIIGHAEANAMHTAGDAPTAHQTLSDLYAVVGWTLIKADQPLGAWIAAQRAIHAAEHAGDLLRTAAATRCLAEVHMRAGNHAEATRTAFLATIHLEAQTSTTPQRLIIRGASLLSAAAASARRGDRREASAALTAAARCADELGQDRADLATTFGPTNVAIHAVAIAIELGDARDAIRHIPSVRLDQMPKELTERRSRFLIDVARTHAQLHDHTAATHALIDAETIAPAEVRHHRLTRQLLGQLLTHEHRSSPLRPLAKRCGLVT